MKKKLCIVIGAIIVAVFLGVSYWNSLYNVLLREIQENTSDSQRFCKLNISELTDFEWDRVVLFSVGSYLDDIEAELGFRYYGRYMNIDGMLFVKGNRIVKKLLFPYDPEDIEELGLFIQCDNMKQRLKCFSLYPEDSVVWGEYLKFKYDEGYVIVVPYPGVEYNPG